MPAKPAKFKGLTLVMQRENVAKLRPMPSRDIPPEESLAPPVGGPAPSAVPAPDGRPTGGSPPIERGGRAGPEPTRYGDWERAGRCIDF